MSPPAAETIVKLARALEAQFEAAFHEHGWRIFWVQRISDVQHVPDQDVISALVKLQDLGKITIKVRAQCPDGHTIWSGAVAACPEYLGECRNCSYPLLEDEPLKLPFAEMTDEWAEELADKQADDYEKKTLQLLGISSRANRARRKHAP